MTSYENATVDSEKRSGNGKLTTLTLHLIVDPPPCLAAARRTVGRISARSSAPPAAQERPHHGNGTRRRCVIDEPRGSDRVVLEVEESRCRCGTRTPLPWIHPEHPDFTRKAVAFALREGITRSYAEAADRLGCSADAVRRLCLPVTREMARSYRPTAPTYLAIDEAHIGNVRDRRRPRVVLVDAAGPTGGKLIDVGTSTKTAEVIRILNSMRGHDKIRAVAMDGAQHYATAVRDAVRNDIDISYDRWHINNDFDELIFGIYKKWASDTRKARTVKALAARTITPDLLRRDPEKYSDEEKAVYTVLKSAAPRVAAFHAWSIQVKKIYLCLDADKAGMRLQEAILAGEKALKEHRSALSKNSRSSAEALVKRLKDRGEDILNGVRIRLPDPQNENRTIGLTTGAAESINRRLKEIHAAGNGLHPTVFRVRALCQHGPLTVDDIETAHKAIQALPKKDPARDRRWQKREKMKSTQPVKTGARPTVEAADPVDGGEMGSENGASPILSRRRRTAGPRARARLARGPAVRREGLGK